MNITKKTARASIQALTLGTLLMMGFEIPAWASTTLNFDSIATPNCGSVAIDPIPSGYGGFTWDANLAVECNADYMGASGQGNSYGAPSILNAIYNQAGTTSEVIKRGSPFVFDGAMVSGWTLGDAVDLADDVTAESITIRGFLGGLGGTLVGSETITLAGADGSAALGYLVAGGISGNIDTLQITTPATLGSLGNFWLLDNFQYSDATLTGVPEPASVLLLGSGLIGLLAICRRKLTSNSN